MTSNNSLAVEAANLVSNVDQLMIHEILYSQDSSSTIYDAAAKLERARNILLTLGDRAYRDERKMHTVDIIEGVPF
jgi:hypothetical protein